MIRILVPTLLPGMLLVGCARLAPQEREVEWIAYGRDVQGTRYLPASEIMRDNVHQLAVAWTYRTGETDPRFATRKPTKSPGAPNPD